jgi:hypothetical protein
MTAAPASRYSLGRRVVEGQWRIQAYTDQNERDHAALADAASSGRVAVEVGM